MEQIAIISDIHGNIPALEAVLQDIERRGIKKIFCLGDMVGKGPHSPRAMDIVKERCEKVVAGNWETGILDLQDNEIAAWHRKALGEERLQYLRQLPIYVEFYMSGKLIRLCHASPNDVMHRVFPHSEKDRRDKLFEPTPTLDKVADVVGYGDIHNAYMNHVGGKTVFNVGSVGNPLDIPQASYAIIEGEYESKLAAPFSINFIRVPYDIEAAIKDATSTDMLFREEYINEIRTAIYRGNKK